MKAKSELGGNAETLAEMASGAILDMNGEPIDPIWAAEFRGFFWGEGTLGLTIGQPLRNRRPDINWKRHSIAIIAGIGLRSDDAAVLYVFQARLGGKIRLEPYQGKDSRKTTTRWVSGTAANNLRIAELLKSPTGLPFNKANQLALWEEAVRIKLRAGAYSGSRYSDEDHVRILAIGSELVRLRQWSG